MLLSSKEAVTCQAIHYTGLHYTMMQVTVDHLLDEFAAPNSGGAAGGGADVQTPSTGGLSRAPERGGVAAVMLAAKALPAPTPPTPYLLMLRVCQGKVSPLDGVTPSCCPRPLLHLATQCCRLVPEERPDLAAVLEQLHDKVLRWVDDLAHAGARRPLEKLEGWRDAAERTANNVDPTSAIAVAPHSLPAPPTASSVCVAPVVDC